MQEARNHDFISGKHAVLIACEGGRKALLISAVECTVLLTL